MGECNGCGWERALFSRGRGGERETVHVPTKKRGNGGREKKKPKANGEREEGEDDEAMY